MMDLIFDTETKDLSFNFDKVDPYYHYIDIYFKFRKNGSLGVEFDNLKFGMKVTHEGNILMNVRYPIVGSSYISTDQDYLEIARAVGFRANREYFFEVWIENAGQRIENSTSFIIPKPEQPFPSWIWNDETGYWEAPIPAPQDGNFYDWNEETLSWDIHIFDS